MGCSASCSSSLPTQSPYEVPGVYEEKKIPDAIHDIMGQEVDRSHPMYLYALFGLTRLVEQYKRLMFPTTNADLITFCEEKTDYIAVVNEVYETLNYNEIAIDISRLGNDFEHRAKDAVQELAYLYFLCSVCSIEVQIVTTMVFKVDEEFMANKKLPGCDETLKVFYEDTLKMLIADLERKEIYTSSVFQNNRRFQEWMKFKEHAVWRELRQKNVIFPVTLESSDILPDQETGPLWRPPRRTRKQSVYCRLHSIQSSDSIGMYYSDYSQTDLKEDTVTMENRRASEDTELMSPSSVDCKR